MGKFYYDNPDDKVIDEDRVSSGKPEEKVILALIFSGLSLFMVFFRASGFISVILGALGWQFANTALRMNKESSWARAAKIIGILGFALGLFNLVTCISCTSCVVRNRRMMNGGSNYWRF